LGKAGGKKGNASWRKFYIFIFYKSSLKQQEIRKSLLRGSARSRGETLPQKSCLKTFQRSTGGINHPLSSHNTEDALRWSGEEQEVSRTGTAISNSGRTVGRKTNRGEKTHNVERNGAPVWGKVDGDENEVKDQTQSSKIGA